MAVTLEGNLGRTESGLSVSFTLIFHGHESHVGHASRRKKPRYSGVMSRQQRPRKQLRFASSIHNHSNAQASSWIHAARPAVPYTLTDLNSPVALGVAGIGKAPLKTTALLELGFSVKASAKLVLVFTILLAPLLWR